MTDRQQRWFNTRLWPDACRAQGWDVRDRALKLRTVGQIIGREIGSTKDVEWGREFDQVKAELIRLANPDSLDAALRTIDGTRTEQRKRWLHKLTEFESGYVAQLVKSFSRGATLDPDALDDAKLKAVVITLEERARKNPALRICRATAPVADPSTTAGDAPTQQETKAPFIPFENQF